jgi:hypothetical protein
MAASIADLAAERNDRATANKAAHDDAKFRSHRRALFDSIDFSVSCSADAEHPVSPALRKVPPPWQAWWLLDRPLSRAMTLEGRDAHRSNQRFARASRDGRMAAMRKYGGRCESFRFGLRA